MMTTLIQKPSFGDYVIALGGQFVGWLGASILLATLLLNLDLTLIQNVHIPFYKEDHLTLKGTANILMSIGPIIGAPAMMRSGWHSKQPSLVLAGLSFFVMWMLIATDAENVLYRGILIFMVGFLFFGMSNLAMPKKREFALTQARSIAGFVQMIQFMAVDFLLGLKVGIEGLFRLPQVFSSQNVWQSRRFGGILFSVAGLFGILGATMPSFQETGYMLFNTIGGISGFIVNYSWFLTGIQGTHWLSKLLIPGSLLATAGSAMRAMTVGFALDQFGSRLNEMYICGMPLIAKQEEAERHNREAEGVVDVSRSAKQLDNHHNAESESVYS